MNIPDIIFESLETIFWIKDTYILDAADPCGRIVRYLTKTLFCFAVESKDQFPDESSGGKTSATCLSAQVSVRPRRRRGRGASHTGATPQQISASRYVYSFSREFLISNVVL